MADDCLVKKLESVRHKLEEGSASLRVIVNCWRWPLLAEVAVDRGFLMTSRRPNGAYRHRNLQCQGKTPQSGGRAGALSAGQSEGAKLWRVKYRINGVERNPARTRGTGADRNRSGGNAHA